MKDKHNKYLCFILYYNNLYISVCNGMHIISQIFTLKYDIFRIFGGFIDDIKRKKKFYLSDFKDGLHIQCLASFIFLYFACLAPTITFGGLLIKATEGYLVDSKITKFNKNYSYTIGCHGINSCFCYCWNPIFAFCWSATHYFRDHRTSPNFRADCFQNLCVSNFFVFVLQKSIILLKCTL